MAKSFAARVVKEAREWVGTPFAWGQSVKGVGCDCKGLVQGVARELGRKEAESFYATFSSYRPERPIPSALLVEGMAKVFKRVAEPKAGDVLLLKVHGAPAHLAIVLDNGRAVHAHGSGPREAVKETRLEVLLKIFPLHSAWRWRRA
jgi:cell wall-associated NlpC family hydrolase